MGSFVYKVKYIITYSGREGIEPPTAVPKTVMLPLHQRPLKGILNYKF